MKLIARRRHEGKTEEAIKIAAEGYLYLVVINADEALRVFETAKELGLDIPYPLTFAEFIGGRFFRRGVDGFVIDNADALLRDLARGVPIEAVTFDVEE